MRARIPLVSREREALKREINRQILKMDAQYTNNVDALVLYVLHAHFGFGKKRLREYWEAFFAEHKKLVEYYEMPGDNAWLADMELKKIGVDVAAWNAERENT